MFQLVAGLVGFCIIACMKNQQSKVKALENKTELKFDDSAIAA
jgi:hypothetical protein